jgi:hypothetical protein
MKKRLSILDKDAQISRLNKRVTELEDIVDEAEEATVAELLKHDADDKGGNKH